MIITRTPLRVSFTGGGTDMADYYRINGGAVVSMAINKYIYITVSKKFDNAIRVSYSSTEIVEKVSELHHDLVREAMHLAGITGGIEVTSIADIPSGTGLGSSSSFTVGVLNALFTYTGKRLSARDLAELACKIEIDILGHPIGKQDQYAAAYGGIHYFCFMTDDTVNYNRIELTDNDMMRMRNKLMIFYTGITRSADGVLSEQKQNIGKKIEVLNEMKQQAADMYHTLSTVGFDKSFGESLHQGWIKKQSLAGGISNPEIARIYDAAMSAGAVGGKLLGAGGGGFLLFYCDEEYQNSVREAVGLRQIDIMPDMYGSRVVYFV
ncbi:MAG: GHMP kinase [Clostridia bacterium]|nr:GHMP kinase [Clostridia bacterium]